MADAASGANTAPSCLRRLGRDSGNVLRRDPTSHVIAQSSSPASGRGLKLQLAKAQTTSQTLHPEQPGTSALTKGARKHYRAARLIK